MKSLFFLVEFKGEYHFLQRKIDNLIILWPGENFSINIFNPENSSPEIHAERVFDILKSGQFLDENSDYSPQMEKVLVENQIGYWYSSLRIRTFKVGKDLSIYVKNIQKKINILFQC